MTERLADISARIDGIQQLGSVVNAMKGIAAARAQAAYSQIEAIDSYAATIATAMSTALALPETKGQVPVEGRGQTTPHIQTGRSGLLVFYAEQGFAGAFSERVLDSLGNDLGSAVLFLIGTRGISVASTRGHTPTWSSAMPSHTSGIPRLADEIAKAIYHGVEHNQIDKLDVAFSTWKTGHLRVERQALFPIDLSAFPSTESGSTVTQLPVRQLVNNLSADYLHALICRAALHAFSAENEARMEAMSAAANQIGRELDAFQAKLRRVRQEEITAEIIELSAGTGPMRR